MKVIKPVTVNSSVFVSSTLAETDFSAYNAGTTYALGANVIVAADHRVYESLQAANIGNTPEPFTATDWWLDVGPTNRWAMFDTQVSTVSETVTSMTVVLTPGKINSLAFVNVVGTAIAVEMRDGVGGTVVYTRTVDLNTVSISDWYQYWYEPYSFLTDVVLTDLPPYVNSYLTVTISAATSNPVSLGVLVVGTAYSLGDTQYGAGAGIIDYSRKDTDEFGDTKFVVRKFSRRMTARLFLEKAQVNKVYKTLSDVRAVPCLWVGTDEAEYNPLVVFGFYKDFNIEIAYPTISYCSLEIEGLT